MWNPEETISYYKKQGAPSDQSALVSLLREVQQENSGAIPKSALPAMAEGLGVKESYLLAVIRRIPSLRLSDSHTLEMCGGPNCGKHAALAAAAEKLCKGKNVTLKFVPCMRLCGKGPNLKWDGTLYHKADEALLKRLMEGEK
jgi:NADH:ubiquinone oxidoreductase subunit E